MAIVRPEPSTSRRAAGTLDQPTPWVCAPLTFAPRWRPSVDSRPFDTPLDSTSRVQIGRFKGRCATRLTRIGRLAVCFRPRMLRSARLLRVAGSPSEQSALREEYL